MSTSRSRSVELRKGLKEDYVDESHMQAFAEALEVDDFAIHEHEAGVSSPGMSTSGLGTPASTVTVPPSPRIRKVSALSDFAPVNLKVKRRRKGHKYQPERRQDWLFVLLRWPLLFFIFMFIWGRGHKGVLRRRLRGARTYPEWKEAAEELDEYLRFNEWKKVDEDPYYDWKLVKKVRRSLKSLREAGDVRGVLGVLETCIRTNFAGCESSRLYSETYIGTKDLIESYFDEQENALIYIRESPDLSNEEKKRFFKSANTNLGTSALCLSGGASFGYYHFGVVKAFLDEGLLPRVITGTSAGGLIASLVCTRTDEELKQLLVPELANRITACDEPFGVWFKRFWTKGARFDSILWARKCTFFTRGSMTFREAYTRTGRILNISVIPADRHSPTKLLNYINSPDTVIWSALLASAAVPGILNPVVIMHKLKDGRIVPWNWGSKFKDGSLRVDIPVQALNLYFNVTHPVVSQVNPHVHLFFFAPRGSAGKPVAHSKGKGWRGNFLLSAAEQWLKLELTKNFKVIRDLELLPQLLGQDWSSVFLQRFDGGKIWPRTRIRDWLHILSDPDPPELSRMIGVGQIVTWPKLHMIANRSRLEKQIFLGRRAVRESLQSKDKPRTIMLSDDKTTWQALARPESGGLDPNPSTTNAPPANPASLNGTETPLPADTDAEAAFPGTPQWPPEGGQFSASPAVSGVSTPQDRGHDPSDPLRSPMARRKWVSNLFKNDDSSSGFFHTTTADPPSDNPIAPKPVSQSPSPSSNFFKRLRTRSFPSLSSPFSSLHLSKRYLGHVPGTDTVTQQGWRSDSSSDDDDLSVDDRRHIRHPSVLNFTRDRKYSQNSVHCNEDGRDDEQDDDDEGYYMY